jgi:hypothetical protein
LKRKGLFGDLQTRKALSLALCPLHWVGRRRAACRGTPKLGNQRTDRLTGKLERISAVMNQGFTRDCGFAIL